MNYVYRLEITLEEPVALIKGSPESYVHECMEYVPGGALLGALAASLGVDPSEPAFNALFLSGETRYLNAYPVVEGRRALPIPFSASHPKNVKHNLRDRALMSKDGAGETDEKMAKGGFVDREAGAAVGPERREQVHVGMDNEQRRAAQGILFAYEALAERQRFIGYIFTTNSDAASILETRLAPETTIRIGRSRPGGYGRARVKAERAETWEEYEEHTASNGKHVLTFLSDVCLPGGAPLWDALECVLRDSLPEFSANQIVHAWLHPGSIQGFRAIWGLPRPVMPTLCKGGVLVVEGLSREALEPLAREGLGLRRQEGYGRIAVDWAFHTETDPAALRTQRQLMCATATASHRLGRSAFEDAASGGAPAWPAALWRRRFQRVLDAWSQEILMDGQVRELISGLAQDRYLTNHQIGNLRSAAAAAANSDEVCHWFEDLCGKTPGEQWRRARVASLKESHRKTMEDVVKDELLGRPGAEPFAHTFAPARTESPSVLHEAAPPVLQQEWSLEQLLWTFNRTFIQALCSAIVAERNIQGRS